MRFSAFYICVTVVLASLSAAFAQEGDTAARNEQVSKPPAIRVIAADTRRMTASLPANGTITPRQEAVVGTNLSGLTIMELLAEEGDMVEKGEVLARLDANSLEIQRAQLVAQREAANAQVAQAQSQVADARVAVSQAEDAVERQQRLRQSGTVAQASLDNAQYSLDSARAKLTTAERAATAAQSQIAVTDAQIRDVDRRINDSEVTALADGLVLERNATLGAVVGAGASPLFRIAVEGELELAAEVAETELAALRPGMPVEVSLPGRSEPIEGTVRIVDPRIDPVTRLGTVRISLPAEQGLRSGAFARSNIQTVDHEALAVPSTALLYDGRQASLQKVVDGVVATTEIELGARSDGYVEVLSGVEKGDLVVSRAGTFVADGDRIRPVLEGAEDQPEESQARDTEQTGSVEQ